MRLLADARSYFSRDTPLSGTVWDFTHKLVSGVSCSAWQTINKHASTSHFLLLKIFAVLFTSRTNEA